MNICPELYFDVTFGIEDKYCLACGVRTPHEVYTRPTRIRVLVTFEAYCLTCGHEYHIEDEPDP